MTATALQIRDIPVCERPRERLQTHGAQVLSAPELLAILLGTGRKGESALDMASKILARRRFSLRRLSCEPIPVTAAEGIGFVRAIKIHAALELGRRMAAEELASGMSMRKPADVFFVFSRLQDIPKEEFHMGILNSQHALERDIKITEGILDQTPVHPREAFRMAVAENAAAVIFVHNHPSGDPRPSAEDILMTSQLVDAGKVLGIEVVDHIIIGKGKFISMKEYGAL